MMTLSLPGDKVRATIPLRIRRILAESSHMTNPQLARRLRVPVDSVRRATRQLVVEGHVMIVRYKKPYRYAVRTRR